MDIFDIAKGYKDLSFELLKLLEKNTNIDLDHYRKIYNQYNVEPVYNNIYYKQSTREFNRLTEEYYNMLGGNYGNS